MDTELAVDAGVARRRRLLRRFLAGYLAGTLVCLGLLGWAVTAGSPVATALVALSALQVAGYTALIVLRLARSASSGPLRVGPDGFDDGTGTVPWAEVRQVRVHRDAVPRLTVVLRKGSRHYDAAMYAGSLPGLVAAFARYTTPVDPRGPRAPVEDGDSGTVTFFFVPWRLRALRRAYLRRCWQVPLMVLPALAGLAALGSWYLAVPPAGALLVYLILWYHKASYYHRLLRVTRRGRGRLLLGPDSLTLPGTDVGVAWAHVHDVHVDTATGRVLGVFTCRDDKPDCPWATRTVPFQVDAGSYHTTLDRLTGAFGRHVKVHSGQ